MIRKFTLLLLACMGVFSLSQAQKCGTDKIDRHLLQTMPGYAAELASFNQKLYNQSLVQQLLVNPTPTDSVYEIPVVVHVMADNASGSVGIKTAGDLSDAFIATVINYVNQAYATTWPAYPAEGSGGVNIRYKFVLAKRDPNCNPTTGIVRVNASGLPTYVADGIRGAGSTDPGEDDDVVKALSIWPRDRYYNIWIVNKIEDWDGSSGGGTAGFAYVPPGNPANRDGAVILAPFFSTTSVTTIHEIGHSFGLHHPFKDEDLSEPVLADKCPNNFNCLLNNDFVCDTEPFTTAATTNPVSNPCPVAPTVNPCTGVAYGTVSYNFMNYTNCQNRFTPGQRHRSMSIFYQYRASLISSLGATPFPTVPMQAACPAITGSNSLTGSQPYGPRDIVIRRTGADTIFRNNSGSYSTDGNQYYIDNICEQRAELKAGQPYSGNINLNGIAHRVRVFIDYNNDGDFQEANELIYANNNTGFVNFNFTPPFSAVACIPLRMRVMADITGTSFTGTELCAAPPVNMSRGQVEDYEVIVRGSSGGGAIVPGLVNVTLGNGIGNPSCDSTPIHFIATPATGVTPLWYAWYKKTPGAPPTLLTGKAGVPVNDTSQWHSSGAGGTYPDWTFRNLDTIYVKMAFPGTCGADTTTDSIVIFRPDSVPPSFSIGPSGPIFTCIDDTVILSVVSESNTGTATWQWYKNGSPIVGTPQIPSNEKTYKVINGVSGDVYSLRATLTPTNCNQFTTSLTSTNTITVNHTTKKPTAQVDLTTGTNPGCAGQVLTYTASGTILGTTPGYQWYVNGTLVPLATAATFSSTFNNGDVVSVVITSSSLCRSQDTAMDAAPAIEHQLKTADITIAQVSGGSPACSGHPVVFSATPVNSGPPAPQFQWLINNSPVLGANSPVFNTTTLVNGDVVKCVLISTDPCVTNTLDTSNSIQMAVTPSKVPKVTFTLTKGNNPGCLDSLVEFTATDSDAGTNPQFEWLVNGFPLNLNNPVYSTTNLLNNDVVIVRVVPTDGGCYLPDTGYSLPVTMVRSPTPNPPIISLINNMLMTNINGSFVWFGPAGQLSGGEDGKYHPTELGQYYAVTNNNGCWSKPSNKLTITLLDINDVNTQPANIYPNPTTGKLTIDWGRNVTMTVGVYSTVGQKLMEEKASNISSKELNLASLTNGIYFVVITDEGGRSSTTRITLNR